MWQRWTVLCKSMEKFNKYSQQDLRRLLIEHKTKSKKQNAKKERIDSPLAKYDSLGKLTCILCRSVIRSENVWKVHINSKAHKLNVESAKKLKQYLIRSKTKEDDSSANVSGVIECENVKNEHSIKVHDEKHSLKEHDEEHSLKVHDESLPEGFFDDPIRDAKARNTEYKNPQEEEWGRFIREIKEQSIFSNAIIAGEQDEATVLRQIEEIDEQMHNWSKVITLEKRKEEVKQIKQINYTLTEELMSSDEGENFEEYLDWRSKKIV